MTSGRRSKIQSRNTPNRILPLADFTFRNHGTLCLLTPVSDAAKTWVEEKIGMNNGFQPYWPTVVIEPRYAGAILEGIMADGMGIQ